MPSGVLFVVYCLACAGLSSILAYQDGPWNILDRLRKATKSYETKGDKVVPRGMACIYCNSLWIATAIILGHVYFPSPTFYVALVFAIYAGGIGAIHYLGLAS